MASYPLSQIQTNLHTNGGDYILSSTKKPYKGFYYKISNGSKFTGKNPQDGFNLLLIPSVPPSNPNYPLEVPPQIKEIKPLIQDNNNPNSYSKPVANRIIPYYVPTQPTQIDYDLGTFIRYFCKKINELKYIEIDKIQHDKLLSQDFSIAYDLYIPFSTKWYLKGLSQEKVFNANKGLSSLIEQKIEFPEFCNYLKKNYLKYYKTLSTDNLYTSGGEFTTKNRQNYIGFYHIHKGTIPMVGKTHTQSFHETLIPTQLSLNKNSKFSEILSSTALVKALPANSNIDNPNKINNIITPNKPISSLTEALDTKLLTKQDPYKQDPYKQDPYKQDKYKQDQYKQDQYKQDQ